MSRATLGDRHPDTLASMNNLGGLLHAKGDLAAAEPLLRDALEGRCEVLGDRHPDTITSVNNLDVLLQQQLRESGLVLTAAASPVRVYALSDEEVAQLHAVGAVLQPRRAGAA